jgi:hypothetical protein
MGEGSPAKDVLPYRKRAASVILQPFAAAVTSPLTLSLSLKGRGNLAASPQPAGNIAEVETTSPLPLRERGRVRGGPHPRQEGTEQFLAFIGS